MESRTCRRLARPSRLRRHLQRGVPRAVPAPRPHRCGATTTRPATTNTRRAVVHGHVHRLPPVRRRRGQHRICGDTDRGRRFRGRPPRPRCHRAGASNDDRLVHRSRALFPHRALAGCPVDARTFGTVARPLHGCRRRLPHGHRVRPTRHDGRSHPTPRTSDDMRDPRMRQSRDVHLRARTARRRKGSTGDPAARAGLRQRPLPHRSSRGAADAVDPADHHECRRDRGTDGPLGSRLGAVDTDRPRSHRYLRRRGRHRRRPGHDGTGRRSSRRRSA